MTSRCTVGGVEHCICIPDPNLIETLKKAGHTIPQCSCGESECAMETLTCAQHSAGCAIMVYVSGLKVGANA